MFSGRSNLSSWLTTKLLATYGRKRFKLKDPAERQTYIKGHFDAGKNQWLQPVDLKRVSFTNLSLYNTEYSVFKYVLETELDVLQKAPYNQLKVYTEIINNETPESFTKPIDSNTFLVGIHTGKIQQISALFLTTEVVTEILESLPNLAEINARFLKSFAMELAVKATIYNEFANIFNRHPIIQNSQRILENQTALAGCYQNDSLVGKFLTNEIQARTQALVESAFYKETHDANTLTDEVLQLCIASLYVYYAQQQSEGDTLSAAERTFCTFYEFTEHSENNSSLMLETMKRTHSIMEFQEMEYADTNLDTAYQTFIANVSV